jgi:hypothetical protein
MPTIATSQLPPPESWDEFENICADLFSLEWHDPNVVRHGRQGQAQHGVDIYGRSGRRRYEGVQCKRKSVWPPTALTKAEITKEVNKAKRFSPPLTRFTIATIANDDVALQALARTITARHEKKNLFSVHVLGWQELSRRIKSHDALIEKYYGYTGFSAVKRDIQDVPQRTADLLIDRLQSAGTELGAPLPPAIAAKAPIDAITPALSEALQRDFARQYKLVMQRSLFPELAKIDLFRQLALRAEEAKLAQFAPDLCRTIYLRASRSCAVRKDPSLPRAGAPLSRF